jgi:hypothetical protein
VALTKDGSSNVGNAQALLVPATDAVITAGGPGSLWGTAVDLSELASPSFGILLRRGDVLGGECLSTERRVDADARSAVELMQASPAKQSQD